MDGETIKQPNKAGRIVVRILVIAFLFLSVFLLFAAVWLLKSWAGVTMEEVVYHLSYSMEGANNESVYDYIFHYGIPTVLITGVLSAAYIILTLKFKKKAFLVASSITMGVIALGCFAACFLLLKNNTDFVEYAFDQSGDNTFIEENYCDPKNVEITFPEKKRNLIYIYLESMEVTYSDKQNGGGFEKNTIPNLTEISKENIDFSGNDDTLNGGLAYAGGQWTMGAMFSMSTGLPLKTSMPDPNDLDTQDSMFPGVVAIGDILKEQGYHNVLMIGSPASFGGRELFYRMHGDYDIKDFAYAKEQKYIPQDYSVFWGYEDEKLYEFSKKEIEKLAKSGEPFNFTMLTVDSHATSGYVCDLCEDEFSLQYANVVSCADRQIADFLKWIQAQDFYENTTVVIVGDHPTMSHDFDEWVDKDYERKVFTTIINPYNSDYKDEKTRIYSTLDMYPTTLSSLGVSIGGDRLALGTDLFSPTPTLSEKYGVSFIRTELTKKSAFMESLNETMLTEGYQKRMEKETTVTYDVSEEGEKKLTIHTQSDISTIPKVHFRLRVWGSKSGMVVHNITQMEGGGVDYYTEIPLDGEEEETEAEEWLYASLYLEKDDGSSISFSSLGLDEITDVVDYLEFIKNNDLDVFICGKDDMSFGLDEETILGLQNIGLTEDLVGKLRYSYAVTIIDGEITEQLSQDKIVLSGSLKDGRKYEVTSAGYDAGDIGSIVIDGVEYSPALRGLNFVLMEKVDGKIIHTANFDTCLGRVAN